MNFYLILHKGINFSSSLKHPPNLSCCFFSFYIILRGKVTIYNLSKGDEENIMQLTRTDLMTSDKNQLERSKLGNFVCHLSKFSDSILKYQKSIQ